MKPATTSQAQPVSVPPIEVTAVTIAIETIEAIRAYSMLVAARSSARKAFSRARALR
nr:hypothetical protein [Marinicauda algicola]